MTATLQQLGERGLDGLSVEAIAALAGVNKTSVYRRWPSKRDLVLAALLFRREEEPPFVESGDLEADLGRALRDKAASMSTPIGRKIMQALMAFNDPDAVAITRGLRENRFHVPSGILRNAMARGVLPADTDPERVSELLVSPILYRLALWNEPIDDSYIQAMIRQVLGVASRRATGVDTAGGASKVVSRRRRGGSRTRGRAP